MKNGFVYGLVFLVLSVFSLGDPAYGQDKQPEPEVVLAPHEQEVLDRVNAERARRGLWALEPCPTLMAGARAWALHMATCRSMYHAPGWRENIACGQPHSTAVMNTWMNSSGHCANILCRGTKIGIGGVVLHGRTYWCQRFR
jgi:uncharacterized protein YkwD